MRFVFPVALAVVHCACRSDGPSTSVLPDSDTTLERPAYVARDGRGCIVAITYRRDGAQPSPPRIVRGTGDAQLDETCIQLAATRRLADRSGKPLELPTYFEAPIQVNEVLWVSPGGSAEQRDEVTAQSEKGGLAREEIQRVVTGALGAVRGCYERALNDDDLLAGKVVVAWIIDGTGAVATVAITEDLPPVGTCVVDVVRGLRFPRPKGGGTVWVTYPFVFSSSPPPAPSDQPDD